MDFAAFFFHGRSRSRRHLRQRKRWLPKRPLRRKRFCWVAQATTSRSVSSVRSPCPITLTSNSTPVAPGVPNVGKSSFFNALSNTGPSSFPVHVSHSTHTDLGKAANFPYATINPEEARIPVPDARFEWLCDLYKPASRVPAFLTCIDIAGLTAVRAPTHSACSHLNQD